jgi:hypothetical protein
MNKQFALRALGSALWLAPAASVWAHPGHGDETTLRGLLHMLEPMHLLPVAALVAVALVLRRVLRRDRRSRDQDQDRA